MVKTRWLTQREWLIREKDQLRERQADSREYQVEFRQYMQGQIDMVENCLNRLDRDMWGYEESEDE